MWRLSAQTLLLYKEEKGKDEVEAQIMVGEIKLTAHNFAALSGRGELSERVLRMGQNRFLLYRNYIRIAKKEDLDMETRKNGTNDSGKRSDEIGVEM